MQIHKYVEEYIQSNDLKPGTVVNYRGLKSLLKKFERTRTNDQHGEVFVKEFMEYCFKKRGMVNSSVRNRMLQLKAVASQFNLDLPIKIGELFKGKTTEKRSQVFLTHDEILEIYNCDLYDDLSESERKSLDVLVFLCQTGIRVGDMKQLTRNNIQEKTVPTVDGTQTISLFDFVAEKTGKPQSVPLSDIALNIIKRNEEEGRTQIIVFNYNYLSKILPVALEKIAEKCGTLLTQKIKISQYKGTEVTSENVPKYKAITYHVGRHSYGAFLLDKGLPIAKVSYILGHDSIATTEKFYKHLVGDSIKADVLNILNS